MEGELGRLWNEVLMTRWKTSL